jgi:hypothetical protein
MQKAAFDLENTFKKPPMTSSVSWGFRAADAGGNRRENTYTVKKAK